MLDNNRYIGYYALGVKNIYFTGWMMDYETISNTMLYDFFGDILTKKQQEYYDLYYNDDLSLSEIGEKAGITRQGVYDIIKRARKCLVNIENKTGIIRKWIETRIELEQAIANGDKMHPAVLRYFHLDEDV